MKQTYAFLVLAAAGGIAWWLWVAYRRFVERSRLAEERMASAITQATVSTKPKLAESNEKTVGEWNSCDIFCRGDSIEVLINGLKQNSIEKLPTTSGQVALQLENAAIEFRHIWLESL